MRLRTFDFFLLGVPIFFLAIFTFCSDIGPIENELRITATDEGYEFQDSIAVGITHVIFENNGSTNHEALFTRLPEGMSGEDYIMAVSNGMEVAMDRFRTAKEQDIDAVIAIMRGYYAEDGYPFVEQESRQAVMHLIRDERLGRLWVAQYNDSVVGYLAVTLGFSLEFRGRDAFIDELFIRESSRGQGFGREALELAEAYCRNEGIRALHIEVEHHREVALKLYLQAGYEDHNRSLMTKWLTADAKVESRRLIE